MRDFPKNCSMSFILNARKLRARPKKRPDPAPPIVAVSYDLDGQGLRCVWGPVPTKIDVQQAGFNADLQEPE